VIRGEKLKHDDKGHDWNGIDKLYWWKWKKVSIYRIEMCAYMMKENCVFIIWTLDSGGETSHLIVKKLVILNR